MASNGKKGNQVQRFAVFQYDIPSRVPFQNPTGYLRRRHSGGKIFAFKTQYSMWLVDADNPPYQLQSRMEKAGCTVDLYPLDPSDNERYLARADRQMRWELDEQKKRDAKALRKIDDKLAEAEAEQAQGVIGWDRLQDARLKHRKERENVLKRSERLVAQLEAAAEQFGIDAPDDAFRATMSRVNGIRALGSARAELYVEMADAVAGTPLAAAAQESEVPATVLADYAEERGQDVSAARAAFTPGNGQTGQTAVAAPPSPAAKVEPAAPAVEKPQTFEVMSNAAGLHYNPHFKAFSAEASDLGLTYGPAAVRITSHRTGSKILLQRTRVERDGENDVRWADYAGQGFTFRLFND
jgi:hypothetical protein